MISDPREWRRITGQAAQSPAFYVQGQGRIPQIQGYVDAPGLIQSLLKIVVRLGKILYNARHRDPEIGSIPPPELGPPANELPSKPEPSPFKREEKPESTPTPKEPEVDWGNVRVIVLAPKTLRGIAGAVVSVIADIEGGRLERKLSDISKELTVEFVLERKSPVRYEALTEAIGSTGWQVIVLVARQDLGFVRGIIAGKIEQALPGKLKGVPIELISERKHRGTFEAVEAAVKVPEPQPKTKKPKELETSLFSNPINHIKGLLILSLTGQASQFGTAVWGWWRRRQSGNNPTKET